MTEQSKRVFTALEVTGQIIAPDNTAGTIYTGNGVNLEPVPVGADGTVLTANSAQSAGVEFAASAATVSTTAPLTGDGSGGDPVTVNNGTNQGDGLVWDGSGWSISALSGIPTCTVDGTGGAGQFTTVAAAYTAGFRAFKIIGNTTQTGFVNNTSNDPVYFFVGSGTGPGVTWTVNDPTYTNTGPIYFGSYGDSDNILALVSNDNTTQYFSGATEVQFDNLYITLLSLDSDDELFETTVTKATINQCTIEVLGNERIFTGSPVRLFIYDTEFIFTTDALQFTTVNTIGTIRNLHMIHGPGVAVNHVLRGDFTIDDVIVDGSSTLTVRDCRMTNCYGPELNFSFNNLGARPTFMSNCGGVSISHSGAGQFTLNGVDLSGNARFSTTSLLAIDGLSCQQLTIDSCSDARVNNVKATDLILELDFVPNPHIGDVFSNCVFSGTLTNTNTTRVGFSNCAFTATNTTITVNNNHYRFNGCTFGTTAGGTSTITSVGTTAGDEPLVVGCVTEAALGTVNANSTGNALF